MNRAWIPLLTLLFALCFSGMAFAKKANKETVLATFTTKQAEAESSVLTTTQTNHNSNMTNKNQNSKSNDYYIDFNADESKKPNDINYTVFPTFDEKEYIEESNKQLLNGKSISSVNHTYLFTILRIKFF